MNKENIKGIIFCLLMAIPAWFLGKIMPIIGGPVFSILIGILVAGLLKDGKKTFQPGINFVSKKVLQYAVILLGFGLNLQMIIRVGKISIPIIISTIATSLIVSYILCRALNIPRKISILVGVGSSICGGSAIAATAPVVDADSDEIAQAISVIFFFNIIAALIFPILGDILGLSNSGFAVFAGTAINDTSSVTAAASSWDTIVKLTRTLAIIPITFCLSLYETKKSGVQEGKKINFLAMLPRFILYFILCSIITSLFDLAIGKGVITGRSASMVTGFFALMKKVSKFFIVMAMGAIGLNTNIVKLIKTGGKPLLLGATCWISIILVSLGMQFVTGLL